MFSSYPNIGYNLTLSDFYKEDLGKLLNTVVGI